MTKFRFMVVLILLGRWIGEGEYFVGSGHNQVLTIKFCFLPSY
uniref:Uncharacterized protein n=1 Tax=Rhizophora mucronata TaxID=61149 RepID=A0A2P2N8J1_RHIMU